MDTSVNLLFRRLSNYPYYWKDIEREDMEGYRPIMRNCSDVCFRRNQTFVKLNQHCQTIYIFNLEFARIQRLMRKEEKTSRMLIA